MGLPMQSRKQGRKVSEFYLEFLAGVSLVQVYFKNLELNSLMPKHVRLG
jgi:hypothetical protein